VICEAVSILRQVSWVNYRLSCGGESHGKVGLPFLRLENDHGDFTPSPPSIQSDLCDLSSREPASFYSSAFISPDDLSWLRYRRFEINFCRARRSRKKTAFREVSAICPLETAFPFYRYRNPQSIAHSPPEAPRRMSSRTCSFPIDREIDLTIRSLAIRMLNILACRYTRALFFIPSASIPIQNDSNQSDHSKEFDRTRIDVRHEGERQVSAREESRIRNNALFKRRRRETRSDRTQNRMPLRISTFTRDSKGKLPMQEDFWR